MSRELRIAYILRTAQVPPVDPALGSHAPVKKPDKRAERIRIFLKDKANAPVTSAELVAVDNTNICGWEFENYETLAEALGYKVTIVNMPMNEPAEVYHKRNKHGVPLEAIQRMINNFEL